MPETSEEGDQVLKAKVSSKAAGGLNPKQQDKS